MGWKHSNQIFCEGIVLPQIIWKRLDKLWHDDNLMIMLVTYLLAHIICYSQELDDKVKGRVGTCFSTFQCFCGLWWTDLKQTLSWDCPHYFEEMFMNSLKFNTTTTVTTFSFDKRDGRVSVAAIMSILFFTSIEMSLLNPSVMRVVYLDVCSN